MIIVIVVAASCVLGVFLAPAVKDGWHRWVGPTIRGWGRPRGKARKDDWDELITLLETTTNSSEDDVSHLKRAAQRLRGRGE